MDLKEGVLLPNFFDLISSISIGFIIVYCIKLIWESVFPINNYNNNKQKFNQSVVNNQSCDKMKKSQLTSHPKLPSFLRSIENIDEFLSKCPFMALLQTNEKVENLETDDQNNEITIKSSSDTTDNSCNSNNQLTDKKQNTNLFEDQLNKSKETFIDDSNHHDDNNLEHPTVAPNNNNNNNDNNDNINIDDDNNKDVVDVKCEPIPPIYSFLPTEFKRKHLNKQFEKFSPEDRKIELKVRHEQLNKLLELMKSEPNRFGEISIAEIENQMSEFYL